MVQVLVAGCVVGALALGLGYFIFNCTNAIITALDTGNLGAATFLVVTGIAAVLFYGLLLLGVWVAFARYAKTKLNIELPGHESRLY